MPIIMFPDGGFPFALHLCADFDYLTRHVAVSGIDRYTWENVQRLVVYKLGLGISIKT